jgi:HNH endonuclease
LDSVSGRLQAEHRHWQGYDTETETGKELWEAVSARLMQSRAAVLEPGTATVAAIETHGFGKPQIILPRLGQGLFRILVTDAYSRRCAITGERTLPVLEAAHIKPYSLVKRHELPNGLLMRSDLHRLLDEGYLTVDPGDRCVLVSKGSERNSRTGRTTTNSRGRCSESQTKHGRNPHWRIWSTTPTTCFAKPPSAASVLVGSLFVAEVPHSRLPLCRRMSLPRASSRTWVHCPKQQECHNRQRRLL